ncbi:DUF3169 family protein [[Clostridium] dakarense]|uniref:DUF3169 family protein n=1 Tax=Faecalimicrobium dakarense TaxID=1301100 RepID=UPI0004ACF86B|nr:DUF3169 family protein [[Clostridium] dakarense]
MNNKSKNEIEKEDKKAFKSIVISILLYAIGGFFLGIMAVKLIKIFGGDFLGTIAGNLKQILGENVSSLLIDILDTITPFASLILSILVIIVSKVIYTNSRKGYDLWKQANEDDNSIDKIEENLSYLILLISVNMILGLFFFGIGIMLQPFYNINGELSNIQFNCFIIGFILCFISSILIQIKITNLTEEINPLLKGSVYDRDSAKKWVDRYDESIKLNIFKSAYKAYRYVSRTCLILWIFCFLGYYLWDFGIMPMIIVIIIWLVQIISYCMESIKYSKVK